MGRFAQRLNDVLGREGWKQVELARRCGVSNTNVSRWCRGLALPDRDAMGKVAAMVAEPDASDLLVAWVADSLPDGVGELVEVRPRVLSSRLAETTEVEWPEGLGAQARRKFSDFARLAISHPDVMKIVDVLHAAAMRMEKGTR